MPTCNISWGEQKDREGQKKKAQEHFKASLKRREQVLEMNYVLNIPINHKRARILRGLCMCYNKMKHFRFAEEALLKSVKIYRDLNGEKSVRVINGYKSLFNINMNMKNTQMAALNLQKHLKLKAYITASGGS